MRSFRCSLGEAAARAGPRVGREDVLDGELLPPRVRRDRQGRRRPWARCRRTAAGPPGTPRRTPRWRRCRPPARCRRAPRPRGPARPPGTPRRRAGRTPRSPAASSPPAGAASGTRSGQARPSAIGISIVGGLACTSVEPSTNSTIECTTLVGCTTTSIRSNGMPKSRCASITSSPLLTRVAELIVMTGPMSQVGWASACSRVTSAQLARGSGRGTARRSRSAPAGVPPPGGRRAGTARARSARSRPARSGRAWRGSVTSGPPMISAPCWPARGCCRRRARRASGAARRRR